MKIKKVILPRDLDKEISQRIKELKERYLSKVEVNFNLYGIFEEETAIVKDWLYSSYLILDENLMVKESSAYKIERSKEIIKYEFKKEFIDFIEKHHKERVKRWDLIGSLHSHPERRCRFEGYKECNPSANCFSEIDLFGALVISIIREMVGKSPTHLSIVYCEPENKYVAILYPGNHLVDLEIKNL